MKTSRLLLNISHEEFVATVMSCFLICCHRVWMCCYLESMEYCDWYITHFRTLFNFTRYTLYLVHSKDARTDEIFLVEYWLQNLTKGKSMLYLSLFCENVPYS